MSDVKRYIRKVQTGGVILTTLLWSMAAALGAAPSEAAAAGCTGGGLIKGTTLTTVYYCGADGKRYVFTNDKAYFTWYSDFSGVQTISDSDLAAITIGGNVTYRPGTRMIKIQSDPKVYAIGRGGELRPIASEDVAKCLYGNDWSHVIDDLSDSFFVNYKIGNPIAACTDFDPAATRTGSPDINGDKNLGGVATIGGTPSAPSTPAPASGTGTNETAALPSVTSISPPDGGTGVTAGTEISATFNHAMDASTVNANSVTLTNGSSPVPGTVTYSGNKVTFVPTSALSASTMYTFTIGPSAKDANGNALQGGSYYWSFTTAAQ